MSGNWEKLSKCLYRNNKNGAFIAVFNFGSTTGRVPLVYLNEKEYRGGYSDYVSAKNLADAKKIGDNIESAGLIPIHSK